MEFNALYELGVHSFWRKVDFPKWKAWILKAVHKPILSHIHIKPTHFASFCGVACGYPWVAWGYLGMAWRVMRGLVRGGLGPGVAWGWLGVAGGGLGVAWDDFTIRELSGNQWNTIQDFWAGWLGLAGAGWGCLAEFQNWSFNKEINQLVKTLII